MACSDASYDIYAFTETWLNSNTVSRQIFGMDFSVYRTDRSRATSPKNSGGGVLLAVRATFRSRQLYPPNCTGVEQLWVSISLQTKVIFVCVLYLPPDRLSDPDLIDQHLNSLFWIVSKMNANDDMVVIGDFNLSSIKWTLNDAGFLYPQSNCSNIGPLAAALLDSYSTAGLLQLNSVTNENHRLLDLCFSSRELVPSCSVHEAPEPLVKHCRHHPPLQVSLKLHQDISYRNIVESISYDYRKADFGGMTAFFENVNWDDELRDRDVNASSTIFTNIVGYAIEQFVPKKTSPLPTHPPWSNLRLKQLKRSKRAALKKFCKRRSYASRKRYARINKQYRQLNKQLYRDHQRRLQSRLKTNPKSFWNYVKDQRNESGLPSTMNNGDDEKSSVDGIADLFRSHFCSVFVNEELSNEHVVNAACEVPIRSAIEPHPPVSSDDVRKAALHLKYSSSIGPDGIPSLVIKNCIDALSVPLASIFNLSLNMGTFPDVWKNSFVFPVYKKGDKQSVVNYRGIAALCAVSKLFELIVLDYLKHNCSSYIAAEQHGFVQKRSTATNLVQYTSFIIRELENGRQVDAIYTDLSAAFDKINHKIAVAKLERLGFHGSLLDWLQSYLTGRRMSVKIGDHISQSFPVSSGVPQGSHLGPFVFLLYLNDVHFSIRCLKLSYADDFKLYFVIKEDGDVAFLQQQLNVFSAWCHTNRMVLNVSKCSIITFCRKKTPICFSYSLHGQKLNRETTVKDLGVLLDSQLTFKEHVSYVVGRASSQLGFIFRFAKEFRDISCLKTLYCSLVRSTLEYCSVVWAPFYNNAKNRIESIQRRFVRFALRWLPWRDPVNLPNYESRCNLMSLQLLSIRRDVSKAVFIADLLRSQIDCAPLLEQLCINIRRVNLRTHAFFCIPHSRTNYGANEPMTSMCKIFNRCYTSFDFTSSRNSLKYIFYSVLSS